MIQTEIILIWTVNKEIIFVIYLLKFYENSIFKQASKEMHFLFVRSHDLANCLF